MRAGRPLSFDPEKVLDKILIHFWKQGYKRTSMDDICKICRLSKPSLYNKYGSKEDLFLLCFNSYNEKFVGSLLSALQNSDDIVVGFKALLTTAVKQFKNPKLPTGCMAITGLAEVMGCSRKIDLQLTLFQKQFLKTLTEYFASGLSGTSIIRSRALAQFAVAQLYSLAVFSRSNEQLFNLDAAVEDAVKAFYHIAEGV